MLTLSPQIVRFLPMLGPQFVTDIAAALTASGYAEAAAAVVRHTRFLDGSVSLRGC